MMAMSAPLPVKAAARVMDPQPVIGGVSLVDVEGRTVTLRDALTSDSPVMVNFIFTSCTTICPVMSAGFSQLARRLATENRPVRLVSISIDPEYDTPARLREYAEYLGARDNWVFLTGSRADSEAAQKALRRIQGVQGGAFAGHLHPSHQRRTVGTPRPAGQRRPADARLRGSRGWRASLK